MPKFREHAVTHLSWLFLSSTLLACGDDATGNAGAADAGAGAGAGAVTAVNPKVDAVVVPFPFTTELSDDAAALLTTVADDGTLVFEGASKELDGLQADTIVIVPASKAAPFGLLRRIDAVDRSADSVTLSTRQASLLQAFRKVDITVEAAGPREPSKLPTIASALSADSSGKFPFTHDIDWVVFDGDEKPTTTEDRVLVSGTMEAAVGYTFHIEFDWGELQDIIDCLEDPGLSCIEALNPFQIASGIGFQLTFVADLSGSADLDVSGAAALSFEKEIPLADPALLALIHAGPIVLTPRLAASAGVSGGASAKLDIHVAVSGGVEFGIDVQGASVSPVGKGPYLDTPSGAATIQNTASARAFVKPRIELLFYDVIGPTIGLEPYAEVKADTEKDPCWRLTGGLDATLGIHIGVGPVSLLDDDRSVPIDSDEFASGSCPLPSGVGGGFLFTGTTSSGVLALSPVGEPLWIRDYVRDDIHPLHTSRAVTLLDTSLLVSASDGAVLHTDASGALLEAHALDFARDPNTHVGAMVRTEAGGAWLAGDTPLPDGSADGWVARFAPDGTLLDAFAIRGPLDERPKSIVLLDDGGALIAGESFDAGSSRGWAARVAQDGSPLWFVRLVDCALEAGLGEDAIYVRAAALTHDGNFALAGFTFYPDYRGMLAKLDQADGSLSWGQTYALDIGLGLQLESVAALESGGFLVGGTQVDIGPNDAIALAETDSAGNVAWLQRYDTPGRDGHVSLWRTPADNGVIVAAMTDRMSDGVSSALVMKVPRKNGEITFDPGSGASISSVDVSDAGVCLASEPYADGVIEPLPAALVELPNVVDSKVTPKPTAL